MSPEALKKKQRKDALETDLRQGSQAILNHSGIALVYLKRALETIIELTPDVCYIMKMLLSSNFFVILGDSKTHEEQ